MSLLRLRHKVRPKVRPMVDTTYHPATVDLSVSHFNVEVAHSLMVGSKTVTEATCQLCGRPVQIRRVNGRRVAECDCQESGQ